MGRTATGIDVGSSTVKLIRGEVKGTSFVVSDFFVADNPDGTLAGGWGVLQPGFKPTACRVGITGRDVNVRYTRVPRLPDWQLRKLMRFEAQEVGGQSESEVASDFNVLPEIPEIEGEDVVVLCMAREALLEEHTNGLAALGGKLDAFTPNAIGLYNAFLHYGVVMEDTVLVANLGRESLDVVLVRGTDLIFARNLAGGSKLFDEAIAQRFEVDVRRAEEYKVEEGTLDLSGSFSDANQEKAARAMTAAAGQILSLLQSAVLFAKSQVKLTSLKLDRVFLCGGGAALPGLTQYLKSAMGVPVELFDPFVIVDTSKLAPDAADALDAHRLEAVCALGLATAGSDPDAYSIEILPESVRKRRDFLGGPAFLIAAAVLAVAFLGLYAFKRSGDLEALSEEAATLDARFRRADSQHRRTAGLLEENAELEAMAHELFAIKGAGEQMARALDVLERELPEDFWLDSMTLSYGWDTELGVERADERPFLRLRGRAREGTDSPTILWEGFVAAMRAELAEARIKDRMGESDFTLDMTSLARVAPGEEAPDDEAGVEGEG
jgi:type IV pilus assembly protein PilM